MFWGQFWTITTTKKLNMKNYAAKSECVCCCSPLAHTPWGAVEPPCFQKDWPHMQGCQEWPLAMPSQPPPPSYCPENKADRGRPYWHHVTDALNKLKNTFKIWIKPRFCQRLKVFLLSAHDPEQWHVCQIRASWWPAKQTQTNVKNSPCHVTKKHHNNHNFIQQCLAYVLDNFTSDRFAVAIQSTFCHNDDIQTIANTSLLHNEDSIMPLDRI